MGRLTPYPDNILSMLVRDGKIPSKAALQEARDNTALETFQAYIDALYYYGTTRLAKQKLAESDSLL